MKTETRMDELVHRLDILNALVDLRSEEEQDDHAVLRKRKKKTKTDGNKDGFLGGAVGEILFRRNSERRPGILGITDPSDGHPQEELTPDFQLFRPLAHNNQTWILYWPDLHI